MFILLIDSIPDDMHLQYTLDSKWGIDKVLRQDYIKVPTYETTLKTTII